MKQYKTAGGVSQHPPPPNDAPPAIFGDKNTETCKECKNADKPGWKFHCEQWRKGDDLSHEACNISFTSKKPVEKSCFNAEVPETYNVNQDLIDEHKRIGTEYARLAQERAVDKLIIDAIKPLKSKEKTMLKRLKHVWRMIATAWHYYLIYILCGFAHPSVMWYGEKAIKYLNPEKEWDSVATGDIARAWIVTLLSIAIVTAALYAHHRYTKWYHGEK